MPRYQLDDDERLQGSWSPEQELAGAVLRLAVLDTRSPYEALREEARRFFTRSGTLAIWAEAVGVDPQLLRQRFGSEG